MDILFLSLHVLGAVFIVGPMVILPMTGMRALRAGAAAPVNTIATTTSVFSFVSIAVAALGFGLVGMAPEEDHVSLSTRWVVASIVLWLVALLLTLLLVVPALRRGAESISSGGSAGSAYGRVAAGSGLASVLIVAVVVLMVWKP